MTGAGHPTRHRDGSPWEDRAGYSRAARAGEWVAVSGTTAPDGAQRFPGDTFGQATAALEQVIAAVEHLGGSRFDIIRTRLLLVPGADVDAASRAHRELLGDVSPANSVYFVAGLVGEGLLVEIEADAVVGSGRPR
ncbi:Enamine deaminase RidA, house cleaning of reactive enamine intermediates, YjgF/YER057c/UK114 family [Nakamurella panacisegetis]|uniref:Enamine deaminase RidA, house cleaning of reactive enamine intermediates, YjgF/YER057c/UK114 family n=1 Tax=Nakamurella panacisegetis TaxID=1090615 RepID=A0A1H0MWF8_9ACTN|nr:Rid family hydrolase [Nakamurella panacisegetis]SDO84798.1 Enamine deaminase RidA, house cleaning of reactive enamine intermediates, YjgF/YER057c/UK114 family [Nakamurella panacisegetis]